MHIVNKLTPNKFMSEYLLTEDAIILDIRTIEELNDNAAIPNAIHINFFESNFESKLKDIDKNNMLLIYCESGSRSNRVCQVLKNEGFENVAYLEGGIIAWDKYCGIDNNFHANYFENFEG